MILGAQLYTARDLCKTLDDFSDTLKKVADIGYTTVQVSGTCDFEPEWLKEELQKTGLKCVITHVRPADSFYNDTQKVIADHNVFDCKYLGLGAFGFKDEETDPKYSSFVETYKPVTKELKEAGKLFMYHNHGQEFYKENGKTILERMAEDFAADELGFTLDVYWAQKAGGDPAVWIEKFKNRVPCLHYKDMDYLGRTMYIGGGNMNFERIIKATEDAKTEYVLVEQDDCNGENPIDCFKRSYDYLTSLGLK